MASSPASTRVASEASLHSRDERAPARRDLLPGVGGTRLLHRQGRRRRRLIAIRRSDAMSVPPDVEPPLLEMRGVGKTIAASQR